MRLFNDCAEKNHAEVNKTSRTSGWGKCVAELERTPAVVTRLSVYDTLLTCFQYGAPNRRFTSEMGQNTILLWMECGARRPSRMGLRLKD